MTQTSIWPLGDHVIEDAPDHPVMQAVAAALEPLRPALRSLTFDPPGPRSGLTLGLGSGFHLISIRQHTDDLLLLDLPVGDLMQTPEALCALLERNAGRDWAFRVDSVTPTAPPQCVVVLEHLLPLEDIPTLPARVLSGWRARILAQGLLDALNGQGDPL
ncbi:hypothetical protein QOL99_00880 [Deinococcus sp. MIMF12]|uniref:Uncharacterized protein n=1 Tax=Deinococcus rhizophilus TaxID=3049544 RepID=A0ABT7JDZ2_9DEIO|nr:hypothetical protein [Deinococcus rhizophilus]MDL2342695.1 hypothetical protein [Deinococcus rhizophilus]